jgi:hypothetical protein
MYVYVTPPKCRTIIYGLVIDPIKHFRTTLKIQNSIPEEIKSRLSLGAWCHLFHNFLASHHQIK